MRFRSGAALLAISTLWMHLLAFPAAGSSFTLNVDVPSGHWKAARLKDLPKGTVLSLQIESNGHIQVAILDSKNYRGQPDTERPLFVGKVETRLSFTVSVQDQGDHFILLDNRQGNAERKIQIRVQAIRREGNQTNQSNKLLQEFERKLHRIFVFERFPIGINKCQSPESFSLQAGAVLCAEYVDHLKRTIKDRERANDLVSFSLFHQVSRVLLGSWKHPSANGVEKADELATVLMVMLNAKEQAARISRYAIENPGSIKELSRLFRDERHPLSPLRAQKVLQWSKDEETARKWQGILVPRMQTPFLKNLKKNPTSWTDLNAVENELSKRDRTPV